MTITLSDNTTISMENQKLTNIYYNGQIINIDEAISYYNSRHQDDTPISVDDLIVSKVTIATLETKPDENNQTKSYKKVLSRDLDVARTLQSIERLLNDPC